MSTPTCQIWQIFLEGSLCLIGFPLNVVIYTYSEHYTKLVSACVKKYFANIFINLHLYNGEINTSDSTFMTFCGSPLTTCLTWSLPALTVIRIHCTMYRCLTFLFFPCFSFSISQRYLANEITWSEASDPVIATALNQLGDGWGLVERDLSCKDLWTNCAELTYQEQCENNTRMMLNYCR